MITVALGVLLKPHFETKLFHLGGDVKIKMRLNQQVKLYASEKTLSRNPGSAPVQHKSSSKIIRLFSCSTQLSTKFQLLTKTKMQKKKKKIFPAYKLSEAVFIMLINVKMPTLLLAF